MSSVIFFYSIFLFGTQLPERSMPMDSVQACQSAQASFMNSGFVRNIQQAGGTVTAGCRGGV